FAYNSSPSESTKESPFYANYGYNPTAYAERREAPDTPKATNIAANIRKIQDHIKLDLELSDRGGRTPHSEKNPEQSYRRGVA
ncbi:hypothetical protein BN1708_001189, partial [Verticillium longisporum]